MNKKFPFLIGAQRGGHKQQPKRLAELDRGVHKGSAALRVRYEDLTTPGLRESGWRVEQRFGKHSRNG
jgi:hypothetical protein